MTRAVRIAALRSAAKTRTLVLDGVSGATMQLEGLALGDTHRGRFRAARKPLNGDFELFNLTRPDLITRLYDRCYAAGADIVETNTGNATVHGQSLYGLASAEKDMNLAAARLARASADRWTAARSDRPCFVAGAIKPLDAPTGSDPDTEKSCGRAATFEEIYVACRQQAEALHQGGVDLFVVDVKLDTLIAKAALRAILDLEDSGLAPLPIWISGADQEAAGRTLSGRTVNVLWRTATRGPSLPNEPGGAMGDDPERPHLFHDLNRADLVDAICRVLGVREPAHSPKPLKTRDAA